MLIRKGMKFRLEPSYA